MPYQKTIKKVIELGPADGCVELVAVLCESCSYFLKIVHSRYIRNTPIKLGKECIIYGWRLGLYRKMMERADHFGKIPPVSLRWKPALLP